MPVLAPDGGHKFSKTYGIDTRFGSDYRRSCIPHFGSSPPAQCTRGIPAVAGPPMAKNWWKNIITFRRSKAKVRVPTQPRSTTDKERTPLYAECVNMFEGLAEEEVDQYLQENAKIVPLFEINVAKAVSPYIVQMDEVDEELDKEAIRELRQAQEALEKEMTVSQRVKASQLEEVNLGTEEDARPVHINGQGNVPGKQDGNDHSIKGVPRRIRVVL